jgi:hypothetical protein
MTPKKPAQPAEASDIKLTCQQVTDLLIDYLTDALEPAVHAAFAVHLRNCPDCVAFLQTYTQTVHATRTLCYEHIPVEMLTRVQQFLHGQLSKTPGPA